MLSNRFRCVFAAAIVASMPFAHAAFADNYFFRAKGSPAAITPPVQTAPLGIVISGPISGVVGEALNALVSAEGGKAPYSFSVSGGSIPPGISLDGSNGSISGLPSQAGDYSASITATDAEGSMASGAFTVAITPAISIVSSAPATGSIGTAYSTTAGTVSGGSGTYVGFTTTNKSALDLPMLGLSASLSGNNVIVSGTPTVSGVWKGTFTVTDSRGASATTSDITLTVSLPPTPPSEGLIAAVTGGSINSDYNAVANGVSVKSSTATGGDNLVNRFAAASPIVIQYSKPVSVTGVALRFHCLPGAGGLGPISYTIDSSNDGVTWTTRASGSISYPTTCPSSVPSTGLGTLTPYVSTYTRITNGSGFYFTIDLFRPI
jgi:hypothetical protein